MDTSLPSEPSNVVPAPKEGDFYQGGVVFYIFNDEDPGYVEDEIHGLICALEDLDPGEQWSPNGVGKEVTGTEEKMGYGTTNTDMIIEKLGETDIDYAAYQAKTYRGGNYEDWYLPSKHELMKMYEQRERINTELTDNGGTVFKDSYYWSSSEKGIYDACRNHLGNNNQDQVSKSKTHLVLPVRSF